ncbi:MAG: extracellular solute-binding protein [Clostridiales bacterium]|jgi:multiple sugar transport system substrate-binding protein|nr:extracellular solute-binding protein [Clostridiales bacterium]
MKQPTLKLAGTIALALFAILSGCSSGGDASNAGGGAGSEAQASAASQSQGPAIEKITVWSNESSSKTKRDEQIARYNSGEGKEKGIEIEYTVLGQDYYDALKIAAQTDEAPDLYRLTWDSTPIFGQAGWIVPITDMPGGQELVDLYEKDLIVNQHIFDGKVYTLPFSLTTYKMIVNDDLFKKNGLEYPETFDEVRECARIITENGAGQEFGWVLGLKTNWAASVYCYFLGVPSTGIVGFDPRNLEFRFSDFMPVFDMVKGMIDDGSVLPGFSDMDTDQMHAQFAEGRVGMIPGASFDIGTYTETYPAKCNWKVIPTPLYSKDTVRQSDVADCMNLLCIGSKSLEHPEKAMDALKFFYSDETVAELYQEALYIPYRQEAKELAEHDPTANGFKEFSDVYNLRLIPSNPEFTLEVEGEMANPTINGMFSGALGDDYKSIIADVDIGTTKRLRSWILRFLKSTGLTTSLGAAIENREAKAE